MVFEARPVVGNWYRRLDRPQAFQVVAFDADEGTIDLEYFDGTLDEWPLSHWHELEIEACDQPQDWTGAFDLTERDSEWPAAESAMPPEDWPEPLEGPQDAGERLLLDEEARSIPPAHLDDGQVRRGRPRHGARGGKHAR